MAGPTKHTARPSARLRMWAAAALLLLGIAGCGYRLSAHGDLPEGVTRVAVTVLENRTLITGAESIFTGDLIYEITRSGTISLVADPSAAQAVLSGRIRAIRSDTAAHKEAHTSAERRVTAVLDLVLTADDGRVMWEARGLSDSEAYTVTDSKAATEQNRRAALSLLSARLAERVMERLTENF